MAKKGKKGSGDNRCPGCNRKLLIGADCEWCGKMWKCNTCNRWLKVADHATCPNCKAREDREDTRAQAERDRADTRAQAEHDRKVNFAHCNECGSEFPVSEGGCKLCTRECSTCHERYSRALTACPHCPKPKGAATYTLEVLVTEGDCEWKYVATTYRVVEGKIDVAISSRIQVVDKTIETHDAGIDGHKGVLPFERGARDARFSVESVTDGGNSFNPRISTQRVHLRGQPYDRCARPIHPIGDGVLKNIIHAFREAWRQNK